VALAALLLIAAVGWLAFSSSAPTHDLAHRGASPTPAPTAVPPATAPAALLAQLKDAGGKVTLDQQGNLSGLESLSPADQQMVKDALLTRRLARPAALADMNRRGSSLLGADGQGDPSTLIAPSGKVLLVDRPTFR